MGHPIRYFLCKVLSLRVEDGEGRHVTRYVPSLPARDERVDVWSAAYFPKKRPYMYALVRTDGFDGGPEPKSIVREILTPEDRDSLKGMFPDFNELFPPKAGKD